MRDVRQEVIHFWFEETKPVQWFQKNSDFDNLIYERFYASYRLAAEGLCASWQDDAMGALALCLVLDQFPRNMFREMPESFATDAQALRVATLALHRGYDQLMPPERRRFLYLPFEHSESIENQNRAVSLFATMKDDDPLGYDYALRHKAVIERFGRFPHRNAILGRKNTPDEDEYLAQPGAGF